MADETRKFDVSLVTPDGPAFEGAVEMIVVPGAAGEIGVLARHAPLIATLKAGSTRVYLEPCRPTTFASSPPVPGSSRSSRTARIALVDDAVAASEIDDARAREQLESAQRELELVERRRVDRGPLAARAAHQARRESARSLGPGLTLYGDELRRSVESRQRSALIRIVRGDGRGTARS